MSKKEAVVDKWNTSDGREWVVVANWGSEVTVEFFGMEYEAGNAYREAVDQGADACMAKVSQMRMNR